MTFNIKFKRGLKSNLPATAPSGTPLWCEDTKELYIGTGEGVVKVNSVSSGTSSEISEGIYEKINKPFVELPSSGAFSLTDNAVHKRNLTGDAGFILPKVEDDSYLHQILVLLSMTQIYTIDLGTSYYLNGKEPDMSTPGNYDIVYEFHNGKWYVGVLKKAG